MNILSVKNLTVSYGVFRPCRMSLLTWSRGSTSALLETTDRENPHC